VFDPFFSTKQPEGSGLGLSSAFGIIRRHGGRIEATSEVGCGSTFTICIPVLNAPVRKNKQKRIEEINADYLRIMVVDDEQHICGFLREFLSDRGHYVKSVCCGREAMKSLKEERFDLVLCGLVMTDVTGRDIVGFLDTLKTRPKVGLITGWHFTIQDAERENLKIDFVVKKPIDFTELSRCINDLFV
jgi:CheY-like chemotaxis protein